MLKKSVRKWIRNIFEYEMINGYKKKRGAIGLGVGKVLGGVRGAQKQKEKYQL